MSRGFGINGVGATDSVLTGLTSSGSDRRSYSIWFYRTGNGGSSLGNLFFKNNSEICCWANFLGRFFYGRCNAAGVKTANWELIPPAAGPGSTAGIANVWNHFLLTHDQSSGAATAAANYWNGYSGINSSTALTLVAPGASPYNVGNTTPFNDRVWDGFLAHFAIWDNVILGQTEAQMLTAGVHPMMIAPANCVCYLPLDGIHNPEVDFYPGNARGSITGTRFGTSQPPQAPMYIASKGRPREAAFWQAIGAARARQYAVTVT